MSKQSDWLVKKIERELNKDRLVANIVVAARDMNEHSAPHIFPAWSHKVMITTQAELDGSITWWVRLVDDDFTPVMGWHAVGKHGLMNAALQLSEHLFPFPHPLTVTFMKRKAL